MAFSYSDKNFTVIGNLCFVHIIIDKHTPRIINIPPAISDRILFDDVVCDYTYFTENSSGGGLGNLTPNTGFSEMKKGKIIFYNVGNDFLFGYLSFYFPIDSNK